MTIDMRRPGGDRITKLEVLSNNSANSIYENVKPKKDYAIAAPSYILNGGDGYKILKDRYRDRVGGGLHICTIMT